VADALIAAHHQLREIGLGIVVYDAYRPLSVTRLFWEWTPEDKRGFVADPDVGSIHNRGCAVDVGLFSVSTHQPLAMPSDYDEMSERSFPTYAGGTSEQRLHRDLLRKTMEEQRFTVHQREWWHFDHFLWPSYDVLDVPFEQISS
jgi:D-alanyl-D-alanine dipeptidase